MHLLAVNTVTIVAALWLALATLAGPPQPIAPLSLTPSPEPPTSTPLPTETVEPTPTSERPTVPALPTATPAPTAAPTSPPRADDPDLGIADPALTKRGSVEDARVGEMVEFTLVVTNNGNATARDVVVVDPLPAFLDLWNATTTRGLITASGQVVTITIGDVAPGDVVTIRIMTRVNSLAQPPDNRNTAVLSTTSGGDDPSNDQDTAVLVIADAPTPVPVTATPVSTASPSVDPSPSAVPPSQPAASAPPAGGEVAPPPAAPPAAPRAVLQNTGTDRSPALLPLLALLGVGAIAVSLLLRRWAR